MLLNVVVLTGLRRMICNGVRLTVFVVPLALGVRNVTTQRTSVFVGEPEPENGTRKGTEKKELVPPIASDRGGLDRL